MNKHTGLSSADDVKSLQTLLRKREFVREFKKLCPLSPPHRWIHIFDVLQWINIHKDDIFPPVVHMIETDHSATQFLTLDA
jgi:hypothetical protein